MKTHFLACPECHAATLFTQLSALPFDPMLPGEDVPRYPTGIPSLRTIAQRAAPGVGPRREHGAVTYPQGTLAIGCAKCGRHWSVPDFERLVDQRDVRVHHGAPEGED